MHMSMQAMNTIDGKVSDLAVLESSGKSKKPKEDEDKIIQDKKSGKKEAITQQSEISKMART